MKKTKLNWCLDKEDRLKKISPNLKKSAEQMKTKDAKSLREEFQYGTKTDVNKELLNNLIKKSKEIVEKNRDNINVRL